MKHVSFFLIREKGALVKYFRRKGSLDTNDDFSQLKSTSDWLFETQYNFLHRVFNVKYTLLKLSDEQTHRDKLFCHRFWYIGDTNKPIDLPFKLAKILSECSRCQIFPHRERSCSNTFVYSWLQFLLYKLSKLTR